jgi:hypothetical protein
MKHSDFKIGTEFLTYTGRWRCTDVGVRTIAAIKLDVDHDPGWYNGPPFDDSGKARLVTIEVPSTNLK